MQSSGDHRPEPPNAAPPVQMVEGFHDLLRATLLWKLDGLTQEEQRRPSTASGISLLAIVKHSAYVERYWIQSQIAGLEAPGVSTDEDPDADWRLEPEDTSESIIALYESECEKSRAIVSTVSWNDVAKGERSRKNGLTVGWILTHMVEEVARHCGHADILREAIDGATGE